MTKQEWVRVAEEHGYRTALLDVYCFLTGNDQILDHPEQLKLIEGMIAQVNLRNNKLTTVD